VRSVRSSRRSPVSVAVLAAAAALLAPAAASAALPPVPSRFPASGELVQAKVVVRAAPRASARALTTFSEFRQGFRKQIVLATELREDQAVQGRLWYRVLVPGRPNGRTGWVRAEAVALRPTRAEITVRLGARTVELRVDGRVRMRTRAAVGARGMETPLGFYYVTAGFVPRNGFLGAYALETSAYSRLSEWPGGGIVGIHGTTRPDLLGRAVSHGCVRVSNAAALVLRRLAPPGTPIRILR
jgi:lipoprotein-anchoring transpeptidase ErfK/SrfK